VAKSVTVMGMKWVNRESRMEEMKFMQDVGPEAWKQETTGRSRRVWEDDIKMNLNNLAREKCQW
jgi:hypothetical protein